MESDRFKEKSGRPLEKEKSGRPLEKEMTSHSSTLAWGIPWTAEHGEPQSMGSQRIGHNSGTNTFTFSLDAVKPAQHSTVSQGI